MRFKKNIYDKTFITTVGNAVKLCTVFTGLIFLNTASHVIITIISNYFFLLAQPSVVIPVNLVQETLSLHL